MKRNIISCFAVIAAFVVVPWHTDSHLGIQKNMDKTVAFMVPPTHPGASREGIAFMVPPTHPGDNANGVDC